MYDIVWYCMILYDISRILYDIVWYMYDICMIYELWYMYNITIVTHVLSGIVLPIFPESNKIMSYTYLTLLWAIQTYGMWDM